MKKWAWIIAALYGALIIIFTAPMIIICIQPAFKTPLLETLENFFMQWEYWLWLIIMVVAQATFLFIPVDIANKRPVSKKAVIFPIAASALCLALLVVGIIFCIGETLAQTDLYTTKNTNILLMVSLAALLLVWVIWALIFSRMSRDLEPKLLVEKQCRYLFRGSILELLIAVPTHIVARYKDYCCAGLATFVGISFGIAVMLFSFGPGVTFLYADRWKKLHPK